MTILMLLEGDYPPDIRVENEVKLLTKAGIEVILLALRKTGDKPLKTREGLLTIYRKPLTPFQFNLRTNDLTFPFYVKMWSGFIHSIIKQHRIDYIHAHDLPMLRVIAATKLPAYYTIHADLHENYPVAIQNYKWATKYPNRILVRPNSWQKKEKRALKEADRLIVLSEHYKSQLLEKYAFLDTHQILVYPNVPNLDYYENQTRNIIQIENPDNLPVLTYFGRIAIRRGIQTALEALKILLRKGVKLKLLLIGPLEKKEQATFNKYLEDPELTPYIEHIRWIDISELASYMKITDMCISPLVKNAQHESGVANKVFQYMLFGKPVIVSDCKPQADVIREAECGVVFKNQDEKDLADKIQMLIQQKGQRVEMGIRGQQIIRKKYNTAVMGKKLLQLYKK
jgi:glycosyltransferase involved in cell wall biosynthesis